MEVVHITLVVRIPRSSPTQVLTCVENQNYKSRNTYPVSPMYVTFFLKLHTCIYILTIEQSPPPSEFVFYRKGFQRELTIWLVQLLARYNTAQAR